MKIISTNLFLLFFLLVNAQVVEVEYEHSSSVDASNITGVPIDAKMKRFLKSMTSLRKYYKVYGADNQIIRTIDSLSQVCGFKKSKISLFKNVQVKENGNWKRYALIEGITDTILYKLPPEEKSSKWKTDFNKTKNILGYKCFYAFNELDDSEFLWYTTEIPIAVNPASYHIRITGVVLEYNIESKNYLAKSVSIVKDINPTIDVKAYESEEIDKVGDFSYLLMEKGNSLSSEDFPCRAE